jgi:hypothetical protein
MTNALDPDVQVDALARAVAAAKSAQLDRHPEPDELVDYYLGTLLSTEVERIQDHLALCRDCAKLVLDLSAITRKAPAGEGRPTPELKAEWEKLRSRLERRQSTSLVRSRLTRTTPWALAASLLLSACLLVWDLNLHRSLDRGGLPRADLVLVDLAPAARGAERSEERPVQVRFPAGAAKLVLLLNLGDLRSFPHYEMQLLAPGGRVRWRTDDAPRGEDGTFLLEVSRDMLAAPGLYHVLLEGRRGREEVRLADYLFVVIQDEPVAR